jgi:hypothetical protein
MEEVKKILELVMSPTEDYSNLWVAYYLSKQVQDFEKADLLGLLFEIKKNDKFSYANLKCPFDIGGLRRQIQEKIKTDLLNSNLKQILLERGIEVYETSLTQFIFGDHEGFRVRIKTPNSGDNYLNVDFNAITKETAISFGKWAIVKQELQKELIELLLKLDKLNEEGFWGAFYNSIEAVKEQSEFGRFMQRLASIEWFNLPQMVRFYKFDALCKKGSFTIGAEIQGQMKGIWGLGLFYFEFHGFEKGKLICSYSTQKKFVVRKVKRKKLLILDAYQIVEEFFANNINELENKI